jgi:lysophospholipase L1-like esterase
LSAGAAATSLPIVVIGDSHSSFFSGGDRIIPPYPDGPARSSGYETWHVGPGLAASLVERTSENDTRRKALEIVAQYAEQAPRTFLFCFGEIDCRFHIIRRLGGPALMDEERSAASVRVTVLRYLSFLEEIRLMGHRPVVFGAVPTSAGDYPEPYEWPTLGTHEARNGLTRLFNQALGAEAAQAGIPFVSIFDELVDAGMRTREEFFFDGVHLGRSAWPLLETALRRARLA